MDAEELSRRQRLTEELSRSPYDAGLYLKRAECYQNLDFYDLAAGDAYKALLLTDEIQDDSGEYHERVVIALKDQFPDEVAPVAEDDDDRDSVLSNIAERLAHQAYLLLADSLRVCGCLRSAYDFCERGLRFRAQDPLLLAAKASILSAHDSHQPSTPSTSPAFDPPASLPEKALVRREVYPWSTYEPSRFSAEALAFLNSELSTVAPKVSARAVSLPMLSHNVPTTHHPVLQLGLFANEDILPGEVVLHESSLLTANNRLHDPLCDACSAELPPISAEEELFACPGCDDTVFCSRVCLDNAAAGYHAAVCGTDVDAVCKDTEPKEAADALYLLLVARTMAMAETQHAHPLELKEVRFLWGEFVDRDFGPTLPFSFKYNVLYPMHVLEKMDVDIYATLASYDTWVLNTLFAKFRGVASGRVNARTGRPEVCAVHPLWCLANHSCAPNVKWEWGGEIRFWAREKGEVVSWGEEKGERTGAGEGQGDERGEGGIKKGEEVLNHYCDVELKVKERREWARGALGGLCMCDRCVWEASNQKAGDHES